MLDLIKSAYVYYAKETINPPETCFLHDDGPDRYRALAKGETPPRDNVFWGALFEEPRHMGAITIRLDRPFSNFCELLALQYARPSIEWQNSKCYTWYQIHYEDYPFYPEKLDACTFVFHPASIYTTGLRLISHPCNFQVNVEDLPNFTVSVEGPETETVCVRIESGLWGKEGGVSLSGCYNGVAECRMEQNVLCLKVEATEKETGENRTIVSLQTPQGEVSFMPKQCQRVGYMAIPDFGLLIFEKEPPAQVRQNPYTNKTIRQRVIEKPWRTFEDTTRDIGLKKVPELPGKTDKFTHYDTDVIFRTPDERMNEHWKIGLSHLMAFCTEQENGRWDVKIGPYPMFGMESSPIIKMLATYGRTDVATGAIDVFLDSYSKTRPEGLYQTTEGCLNIPYGIRPTDCWIPTEAGYILLCLAEYYFNCRDKEFLKNAADKMFGCIQWIFREIDGWKVEGTWNAGMLPPTRMGDISEWDYFYTDDAITCMGVTYALTALEEVGDKRVALWWDRLKTYRQDIRKSYRYAIGKAPVVALRNGTYAPGSVSKGYLRGWMYDMWPKSSTNALRGAWLDVDHVPKMIECGVFGAEDIETRWILDAFEDNLALNDYLLPKKWDEVYAQDPVDRSRDTTAQKTDYDPEKDWYEWGGTGWQNGYCSLMQCYLRTGEAKAFIRSFYNTYAIHADPDTFWLREHAATLRYPPKTFEEGWMLYRLRAILVWEEPKRIHLCSCVPDAWYKEGFETKGMPTYFGKLDMCCKDGKLTIALERIAQAEEILLRLPGEQICKLDTNQTQWTVDLASKA